MKKSLKMLLSALVVLSLLISCVYGTYADRQGNGNGKQQEFKDVGNGFWAYQAIMDLSSRGIITGYDDKSFKPNASVTRSEFATLLTKAMNLKAADNSQTFADVAPASWDFNAVEAAKDYLTGFKTSTGVMYFYGSQFAVREDMAVAMVKALKVPVVPNNGALAQVFSDSGDISPALQDYVYAAYTNGIMQGSGGKFKPQGILTRAEAATLLERILQKTDKVPIDGNTDDTQKVVVTDPGQSSIKDNDAALSNLTVNGTAVTGFNANTLVYNIALPAGTTAMPVVAAVVHDTGKAATHLIQAAALPGIAIVVVTAEDGVTWKVYTLNFTVAAAALDTDATLSSLSVNGTPLAGFSAGTLVYNVILPAGTTIIPVVTATVTDTGKATISIVQATGVTGLPGNAKVKVTAQDGVTQKTYSIYFSE